jgi:hypothetical protein
MSVNGRLDDSALVRVCRDLRFRVLAVEERYPSTGASRGAKLECIDCGERIQLAPVTKEYLDSIHHRPAEFVAPAKAHREEHLSREGSLEALDSMYHRAAVAAYGEDRADEMKRAREKAVLAAISKRVAELVEMPPGLTSGVALREYSRLFCTRCGGLSVEGSDPALCYCDPL